jgi:hypothetical protein
VSIGIFFTLIIVGLEESLHASLLHGLAAHGYPGRAAARVASLPPVSVLFASLLTSRGFFPTLISPAFAQGLSAAFGFAVAACLVAALASLLRGGRYVYGEPAGTAGPPGCTRASVLYATTDGGARRTLRASGTTAA